MEGGIFLGRISILQTATQKTKGIEIIIKQDFIFFSIF